MIVRLKNHRERGEFAVNTCYVVAVHNSHNHGEGTIVVVQEGTLLHRYATSESFDEVVRKMQIVAHSEPFAKRDEGRRRREERLQKRRKRNVLAEGEDT